MARIDKKEIEQLICNLQKPGRYIGGELNQIVKEEAFLRMAVSYPDLYEVGMSNEGIRILYEVVNRMDEVACERVFAVPDDCERKLRAMKLPLYTLETYTPLNELDLIGFNISHELLYTNILQIIDLGQIPLRSLDREEGHPIVIAGGEASSNPLPMADFIDAFFIGEGEDGIMEILRILMRGKGKSLERRRILEDLSGIEGMFVPSIHLKEAESGVDVRSIIKRVFRGEPVIPIRPLVPNMRITHERVVVEVTRGCGNLCKFCHAGYFNLPYRSYPPELLKEKIIEIIKNTGYEELSLSSLSLSDYRYLVKLLNLLMPDLISKGISISLPSLRVDRNTLEIIEHISDLRKSTLTFAIESACEDIRRLANKRLRIDDLLSIVEYIFKNRWNSVKLYFMIGLPGCEECDEIGEIIELLKEIHRIGRSLKRRVEINVTVSPFVPKPHTPFQWEKQMGMDYFEGAVRRMKISLPRSISIKNHDLGMSLLEGIFSRGDNRLSRVIVASYEDGCRLDSWKEYFKYDVWESNLNRFIPDWDRYLASRNDNRRLPWQFIESGYEKLIRFKKKHNPVDLDLDRGLKGSLDTSSIEEALELFKRRYQRGARMRIRFSKRDWAKYVSHIEFMEIIKRSLRMIDTPVSYTQGYNKRQRIAMGYPLPLGIESVSELCDVDLYESINYEGFAEALNRTLPQGFTGEGVRYIERKEPLMAVTKAVDFLVCLAGMEHFRIMENKLQNRYPFQKRTRGGVKVVGFNDAIIDYKILNRGSQGYADLTGLDDLCSCTGMVFLRLSVGDENSMRIDDVLFNLTGMDGDELYKATIIKLAQLRNEGDSLIVID
jgi:radical SAM family uncharacterized protein/radical SAM-linked protein